MKRIHRNFTDDFIHNPEFKQILANDFLHSADFSALQKYTFMELAKRNQNMADSYLMTLIDKMDTENAIRYRKEYLENQIAQGKYVPRRLFPFISSDNLSRSC